MRIRWHGMVGQIHSWSFVSQNLIRKMSQMGHDVFVKSTNDLKHFPNDLKHLLLPGYHGSLVDAQGVSKSADYLDRDGNIFSVDSRKVLPQIPDADNYDLELAYSILYQGPRRFYPKSRARALIWNLDNSIFPPGWKEYHRSLDYILPSSQFAYDIFRNNGIPTEKMLVVPHGVDTTVFNKDITPYKLQTNKKVKVFCNAIQPHGRKLYDRIFKGYLDAFTAKDDICLVLKTKFKTPDPKSFFEVDVKEILNDIYSKYENPPEIEIINDVFVENIGSLYTACDIVVNMSSIECFWLPGLESLACGNIVISPRYGGQLEYLNDNNSLLIDTKEMFAPQSHQYWTFNPKAVTGDPSTQHFSELLRYAYENLESEKKRIEAAAKETVDKFSWENAAKMILDLPIPEKSLKLTAKKKILYVIPYGMFGGGEIWIREIINKLDRNVYEPHIAFINMTPELENGFSNVGAKVENLTDCGQFHALKCLVESENYAIIHFYNSFSVYEVLQRAWTEGWRCRVVETVHSDLVWSDSMTKVATRNRMVSMIFSVSQTMAQKLNKFGNKNVIAFPQPINWNKFKIERTKKILEQFNIPNDRFTVGFVGRLSPEKNIPVILKCAKSLPDISFVIVGSGPQENILKHMSKTLKNVFFVGKQSNVEEFYAAFDVLMLPSSMEGLPLVLLEAMAVGTPVIASNVGAIKEIINSQNGFLSENCNDHLTFISFIQMLQQKELWFNLSNGCKAFAVHLENCANSFDINKIYSLLFARAL